MITEEKKFELVQLMGQRQIDLSRFYKMIQNVTQDNNKATDPKFNDSEYIDAFVAFGGSSDLTGTIEV